MAQIHRKASIIKKRESTWHPKKSKKESGVQKIRKQITPERVTKVKGAVSSLAKGFNKFMAWGASRAGNSELASFDMNNPMGTQKRTTKRKKKRKSK